MSIWDDWFGFDPPKMEQGPTLLPAQTQSIAALSPQMMQIFQQPGLQPPFGLSGGTGPLSQQMFGAAPSMMGPGMAAMGRMADPAQNMQYAQEMFQPIQNEIANRFASADGARSSGFGQALGRGFAQGVMPQVFNQQAQGAVGSLGAYQNMAARQDILRQQDRQGDLQRWQMGLPGADPRLQYLPSILGTPSFSNAVVPGMDPNVGSFMNMLF